MNLEQCCRLAHVDPITYFADVLVRISSHPERRIAELLPANWEVHFAPHREVAEPALA